MPSSFAEKSLLRIVVLMPVRDDWTSAAELVRRLDGATDGNPCVLDALLVDDASLQGCSPSEFQHDLNVIRSIRVLRLRRNLGHQRAIAIGLVHIEQEMTCEAVLVMDADGEDTAEGAVQLIRAFSETGAGTEAVFAVRIRRTESLFFRVFYWLYRVLHRMLTGLSVRVGNLSIIPAAHLRTLVVMWELWNHYAAAFFRSGLPRRSIPIPRGHRIAGSSQMNFVTLAPHGLSAIRCSATWSA